ncbi:MAG: PepSY-associated TM helix domain-containing protein, partial [Chitinophagaceae bacterium]
MTKIIKLMHLWLSLPAGICITLICITGAILSFETEITETTNRDKYFNQPPLGKIPMHMDSLVSSVNKQLTKDTVVALKIYPHPTKNIIATLSSGKRYFAYINPYSAKIVEKSTPRTGFFLKTMLLHRWLMLPNKTIGKIIVGTSTIFMIFILVTGIIRWIPNRKNLVQNFLFRWKNTPFNRKNLDLHKILGFYAFTLLLVMCFSGLMWSFEWYKNGVAQIFGIEHMATKKANTYTPTTKNTFSWQGLFQKMALQYPDYHFIQIAQSGDIALLPKEASHNKATDKYKF